MTMRPLPYAVRPSLNGWTVVNRVNGLTLIIGSREHARFIRDYLCRRHATVQGACLPVG
jgi:hypothetical protein